MLYSLTQNGEWCRRLRTGNSIGVIVNIDQRIPHVRALFRCQATLVGPDAVEQAEFATLGAHDDYSRQEGGTQSPTCEAHQTGGYEGYVPTRNCDTNEL